MEETKDFKTLIKETLETRGINNDKLSQLTGIPRHYLTALENSEVNKLPAAPYVRGYIKKLSEVLHLDANALWQLYEKELQHKRSGAFDKLPENRFTIRRINKKVIILTTLLILIIFYLTLNYKNFFGQAALEITNPAEQLTVVSEPQFTLAGKINPTDKLTINGVELLTDLNGNFQLPYNLNPGLNTVEFKVKKILGQEKTIAKQIMYQQEENTEENN